jgi:uncharacterized protein YecE (DUF72 family)
LGVLLLQFPPLFRQQHFSLLAAYLKALPKNRRYAVEVRNKSLLNPDLYNLLRDQGVALVWAENPKMPQVTEVTSNFLYVRLEGDRKIVNGLRGQVEVDKSAQTLQWANRLKPFVDAGRDVFVYFGKYYSGFPPSDVAAL